MKYKLIKDLIWHSRALLYLFSKLTNPMDLEVTEIIYFIKAIHGHTDFFLIFGHYLVCVAFSLFVFVKVT